MLRAHMISRALASLACAPLASLAGWLRTEMRLSLHSNSRARFARLRTARFARELAAHRNATVLALQCGCPCTSSSHHTPTHSPYPLALPEGVNPTQAAGNRRAQASRHRPRWGQPPRCLLACTTSTPAPCLKGDRLQAAN